MSGRMPPEWWREYRRRRAESLRAYNKARRQQPKLKAQRRAAELRRRARRRDEQSHPLPLLMPHLQRGAAMSFWDDELRLDLAQEAALAELEGKDPREAIRAYLARESAWRKMTVPLLY